MRRFWLSLALFGCAGTSGPAPRATNLPSSQVLALDGRPTSLRAELAGAVSVIDLWATWCTACEQERPKLERLHAAYQGQGLRVIGLDVGEEPSVVAGYLAEHRVAYPVYLDPDFRMADALGDKRLPTLLVVDRAGRVTHRSASLDQDTLNELKAQLSAKPAP